MNRIETMKKIFTAETTVQEQVINRLLKIKDENENMIGELTLCLRIPRMYHKFIEDHGVHEFVNHCMQILDSQEKQKQAKEADANRLK